MEMDDLPDYEEKYYMNTQTKRKRSERLTGGRELFCDVELQHNLPKVGYYHHHRDFGELSPPICRNIDGPTSFFLLVVSIRRLYGPNAHAGG